LRAFVLPGIAVLSLGSQAVLAGDQEYKVGNEVLVVSIDGNWEELDASEISPRMVAYEIEGLMRWFFEPHPRQEEKIRDGDLRALANDLRREIESRGSDASEELLKIEGSDVSGYYIKGVDPKAGANDYKFMYIGYVVVGDSFPVEFSVMWMRGGDSAANRALSAVRGMRRGDN